jgi:hypothetical protein
MIEGQFILELKGKMTDRYIKTNPEGSYTLVPYHEATTFARHDTAVLHAKNILWLTDGKFQVHYIPTIQRRMEVK